MSNRSTVRVTPQRTTKRHVRPELAKHEASFYERIPWACPKLLAFDGRTLTLETLPTAYDLPDWRPVAELRNLLERVHAAGVHHRDLHVKNIVRGRDGRPLLIDWECSLAAPTPLSYDLHGPDASGVSMPVEHIPHTSYWWGSEHPMCIKARWGI